MFKKNDKVFVRAWQEMLADERVLQDHNGNLYEKDKLSNSFVKDMKRYCGSPAVVEEVTADGGYYLRFGDEIPLYVFRDWTIEEAEGSVKAGTLRKGAGGTFLVQDGKMRQLFW